MRMPSTSAITVTRLEDFKVEHQTSWVHAQSYASLQNDDLLRSMSTATQLQMLRSKDNGESWALAEVIAEDRAIDEHRRVSNSVPCFYLDESNGLLVRFVSEVLSPIDPHEIAYADAVGFGPHTGRLFYQISRDGGYTWEDRQQVIERGEGFDEDHWLRDAWYGRSSAVIEGRRLHKLADGTIVVPAYLWPTREQTEEVFRQESRPEELWCDAPYLELCVTVFARWRDDLSGLEWESGGMMLAPGGYTHAGTCGTDEPTIAFIDEQNWFAIYRTSTSQIAEFRRRNVPLVRQCGETTDGGRTWDMGRSLTFDDGSPVHSPSAYSEFIRSSKTGKWYWVGNILPEPTYGGCDPRHPLQITELDTQRLCLKRDTVTVVEDMAPDDPELVRFSNFRIYEERGSGDFILLMTKSYCENTPGWPELPYPSYRYRIRLGG